MKLGKLLFSIIIIALFIISYSTFTDFPSSNNNVVTLYVLVPSGINNSLPKASFLSNYNLVGNYSTLSSISNTISYFSSVHVNTLGQLISFSLKNSSAQFIGNCLEYSTYICDNRSYVWAIVYINPNEEVTLSLNSSVLNTRLSTLNYPQNIFLLIFSKTLPTI
ncbi:MAG: hypothetical protein OH318_01160 [Candidatus Parvarchaeota archaeon]|nr:hypothetical protein [Candidatus Rehaiarchaeum fermentans]